MTVGDISLGEWLAQLAADPSRATVPITVHDGTTDPQALDIAADGVAAGLHAWGLTKGDRVAVLAPASVSSLQAWFGIARAGLVELPLNPAAGPMIVRHCLAEAEAKVVICAAECLPLLREAGVPTSVMRVVVIDADTDHVVTGSDGPQHVAFASLLDHDSAPRPDVDPASTAVILYTSGTTGPPKGVLLSHRANLNLARHTVDLMGYTAADHLYSVFPLYHSNARYCSVMAGMEAGARVLLHRKFTASGFWDICRSEGITAFNYQGAMLSLLFKQPAKGDDGDHAVRVAFGAPCPAEIFEAFESRFSVTLTEIYGSTEVSLVCEMPPSRRRIGTAGQESRMYHLQVVDEFDRECPPNTAGEIVVRPKHPGWMFDGYDARPEATVSAWRNLWFHTGDRGSIDEDGYLTFIDRVKDTVRRRGENISTWEIERVVSDHPAVAHAAAYGVQSALSEEEVMVAVVPAPGMVVDPSALLGECVGRLTAFALPRYVRVVDVLPMTPSQRVEKYKLQREAVTDDTYDREAS